MIEQNKVAVMSKEKRKYGVVYLMRKIDLLIG
ncbi:hypothetical protein FHS09_002124 [Microbulbifer rhizosphaerae]|uniref:Uncharacterized protein n=1 Tax=Microbulbifer rhizosphaerae TaxID=1562603 RepID=A0A7W4WBM2_9GAMM|nr:hypothetical protein [Microbulbifer rhizosphaerae]